MKRLALCVIPFGLLSLTALLTPAFLSGCGGGDGGGAGNPNVALLGANLELSGAQAEWGINSRRGIEMATEEINAKPEQKIKLKFFFEDNKSQPNAARDAMLKLVTQNNVIAVIGSVSSNLTGAAGVVAKDEKVPLMTHASTNVDLTKNNEYISRICYHDDFQGGVMARFARRSLKLDSVIMIEANGDTYSKGLCESFKKTFTEEGGKIIQTLTYQTGAQDFKPQISMLKELNPPAVWLPGYYNEVAPIIKQAREAGFNAMFLGADGWDSSKLFTLCGPAIKGNYLSNHFDAGEPNPIVQAFVKKFTEKFGAAPDAMAALAYDATYAMADAVNRAKELKPAAIKEAINSIKGIKGVCGTITMGPDREVVKDVVVQMTSETGFIYKETVKP